jgi:hypothetical protein
MKVAIYRGDKPVITESDELSSKSIPDGRRSENSNSSSENQLLSLIEDIDSDHKWILSDPVAKSLHLYSTTICNDPNIQVNLSDMLTDMASVLKPLSFDSHEATSNKRTSQGLLEDADDDFKLLESQNCVVRRGKGFFCSTLLDLTSGQCSRANPLPFLGVRLQLTPSSAAAAEAANQASLSIDIGSKHVTWMFVKWLRLARRYWNHELSEADVKGYHIPSHDYRFLATVSTSPDYGLMESTIIDAIGNNAVTNTIGNTAIGSAIGAIGSTAIGIGTIPIGIATSAIGSVVPGLGYAAVTTWIGIVVISLHRPYVLEVFDASSKQMLSTFNIQDIQALEIAVDSHVPQDYSLVLDIKSCDFQGAAHDQKPLTHLSSSRQLNDEDFGPKGLIGFRRFVRKTAYRTGSAIQSSAGAVTTSVLGATTGAVSTVSTIATGAAKGIVSTAADAARTIATGDPRLAISSAQRTVLGYGKDLVNMVASTGLIVHGLFNRAISYVIIKHITKVYFALIPVDASTAWDCRVVIDVNQQQIKSFLLASAVDTSESADDSVDIFLYHGILGSETLVSQRNIKLSKFLAKIPSLPPISSDTSSEMRLPYKAQVGAEIKVKLHSELGLYVSVLDGRGIMMPQQSKVGGMYVKCKLVDDKGKSLVSSAAAETQHTKLIPSSSNPNWLGEDQIFLRVKDGLDRAIFVRLQILGGLAVNPDSLGYVLIPVEDFTVRMQERFYEVMRFKRLNGHDGSGHGGKYGLGQLRVKFQKIVDRTYASPQASSPANTNVKITPILTKNSPYQTMYPADATLSGHLDSYNGLPINSIESVFISITSSDHLQIIDSEIITSLREADARPEGSQMNNTDAGRDSTMHMNANSKSPTKPSGNCGSNQTSPRRPSHQHLDEKDIDPSSIPLLKRSSSDTGYESSHLETVELTIFENQRRQIYPPYDWSNGNLFSNERKQFSDELGSKIFDIESLASALPPVGYEWYSDWRVDKKYTATDEFGWTYGYSFKDIMSNYGNGVASISPTLRTVRRRKWVRTARNVNRSRQATGIDDHSTGTVVKSFSPMTSEKLPPAEHTPAHRRPTIKTRVSSLLDHWRQEEFVQKKAAGMTSVLATCKERNEYGGSVKIPWKQVLHASVVTDGILSIKMRIHRYFGLDSKEVGEGHQHLAEEIFRDAEVDMFIYSCPAAELKILIDERVQFEKFRTKVKDIIISGTTAGSMDDIEFSEEYAPDTVELSAAADIMMRLDKDACALEAQVNDRNAEDRQDVYLLLRRALRLRLYQAALLSSNLSTSSLVIFSEDAANDTVDKDIQSIHRIEQGDEVSTVNNQIEYLLDIAESRLRDAALCGWNYLDSSLLPICEIYVNRYLQEMVSLLSKFFIAANLEALRGLQSKITLISTFTSHNDRLAEILQMALTPYEHVRIIVNPQPRLSLFLQFGELLSWYAIVLQQDMKRVVSNALSVWRDKNAIGRSELYTYPLPWIPMRKQGKSGAFLSLLPEDTVNYLNKYLEFSRLRKEDMAASLMDSIAEVDGRVALSYAISFEYMTEAYWVEMTSKKWNALIFQYHAVDGSNEHISELVEQTEWLCSVANDALRIVHETMINKELDRQKSSASSAMPNEQDVAVVIARSYQTLNKVMTRALDYISCILFYEMCFHYSPHAETDIHFLDDRFSGLWVTHASKFTADHANGSCTSPTLMSHYIDNLSQVLSHRIDSLDSLSYLRLLCICIDKMVIRFFYILRDLHALKRQFAYNSAEISCFIHDKKYATRMFEYLFEQAGIGLYKDSISNSFRRLDQAIVILSSPSEDAAEYLSTLKSLEKIASGHPSEAFAIAEMIAVCVDLRLHESSPRASPRRRASTRPENPERRQSLFGSYVNMAIASVSHHDAAKPSAEVLDTSSSGSASSLCIENIRSMFDESDTPSIEEYICLLCNPSLEFTPGETSKIVPPLVKVFHLADAKESTTYIFNLRTFILDSIYHNQDISMSKSSSSNSTIATPVKYVTSLFLGADSSIGANHAGLRTIAEENIFQDASTTFVVSNLRASNIRSLDYSWKPSSYMSISVLESSNTLVKAVTSIKRDSYDPDWSEDDPIYITVPSSSVSSKRVVVTLLYKHRWSNDEVLGSVEIPLLTLDISPIQNREFDIDVSNASTRAQAADKVALEQGKNRTRIRLSIGLLTK